ncbi:prepilin-type N-terminal cleavage/methylation domain-containing protein [Patescibacteria group bacterium]|nr:prepilin-type N-terminal cleavage/methylation domain-containing protein [Patescibacteria group bacterium]
MNKKFIPHLFSFGKKGEGFTLIESLITIAIFILGLAAITGSIFGLYRAYYYTFQQTQAIEEARNGVEIMVKQIREAKQGDDGAYIIEKADDYEFIFYSDIDKDNETERVRYFIVGADFKQGVIKPIGSPLEYIIEPTNPLYSERISILSKYVRNLPPIFHYFDGDENELPAPARLKDTKTMRVYLVVNVDPNKSQQNFILESEVLLRNLKTNL